MNIIDAWKAAEEGQRVMRTPGSTIETAGFPHTVTFMKKGSCHNFVSQFKDSSLLADDWEVVKSPKTIEMTMGELRFGNRPLIPNAAKVTITWEE